MINLKSVTFISLWRRSVGNETSKHTIAEEFDFIIAMNENLEIVCFARTILCELGRLEDEEQITRR